MKTCIYPGSFDPVTFGHVDIINRAASTFDKVIVAVGINSSKKYTFKTEQRIQFLKNNIKQSNVCVMPFDGLLADFAYENNAKTIIKGVRNNQDFDYERLLHEITITQQAGIDTHILVADQKLSHISSTAVKELCKFQGLIHEYVPYDVKEALEWVLNGQFIVGVTGEIGMGKSYVSSKIVEKTDGWLGYVHPVTNVDLDKVAHELYESDAPAHLELRENIIERFQMKSGFSRKELGDVVFNDINKLQQLNTLIRTPLLTLLRKKIREHKGLILLNGALLVEGNYLSLCNNNVVVVESTEQQQLENLERRGLTEKQVERRWASQLTTDGKIRQINKEIEKHGHGKCIKYQNVYVDPYQDHMNTFLINPLYNMMSNLEK